MILTVTLNAALDVTYELDAVAWGGSNRVRAVRRRAGGKGVNVARVLTALGADVLATGLLGGDTGDLIGADLDRAGIGHAFAPVAGSSRRTLTAVATASGEATVFNEPGPEITPAEWNSFLDRYRSMSSQARQAVALSAAAVRAPLAGDFDAGTHIRILPEITVQGVPCPS
ncbi:PfkB family carbohydrate kinase [Actinomadura macrotermitis]|uniref:Tagatose-6-phosphate kinase n=1 Tax=Actinomadura macrotermitis TaxID=2585200 RepID=A0A7K0BTS9_9ACTN|nr:PfkB family carbohydrate kinase [Actinomadura macrotermitis]MQY04104.1 Tagatose-6-phosphate kinase [Actinomadura macrotermitis]